MRAERDALPASLCHSCCESINQILGVCFYRKDITEPLWLAREKEFVNSRSFSHSYRSQKLSLFKKYTSYLLDIPSMPNTSLSRLQDSEPW